MRTLIVLLFVAVIAAPAAATDWCGCNGVVSLSFDEKVTTPVKEQAAGDGGVTMVDVYAVLDDVAKVEGPRGVMIALGGFEMELRVTGAEPLAVSKHVLVPHRDFGARATQCRVGTPGEKILDTRLPLCRWMVTFQGDVADVRFDLDPAGAASCDGVEGCRDADASAVYVGTVDARQEGFLFGAGCVPAVLNPTVEPDLTPAPCTVTCDEAGIFRSR
jgi:hypothetical protein